MFRVFSRIDEKLVNPLFEVFDGGDFVLSSYRDVESDLTDVQLYFPEKSRIGEAETLLKASLDIVGASSAKVECEEVPDEDWKLSYRKHFKTERIGKRLVVRPKWEPMPEDGIVLTLDPGLAFGTGRHETTRACLEYIDELSGEGGSFLDMGCGSGILSIAASLLGYSPVSGFDVDPEAVEASERNAAENGVKPEFFRYALGGKAKRLLPKSDLVVANILGPLLVRFAGEIAPAAGKRLVISGILSTIYGEVLAAYRELGFVEESRKTFGEWTTGLLVRV